jgi:hypothetical protein
MCVPSSTRSCRSVHTWALVALVAGTVGCATGPRIAFSGIWTSQMPQGASVVFDASETGSEISGAVSNVGPLIDQSFPITGSVTRQSVLITFDYPIGTAATRGTPVAWVFHGAFTSATTIEGTIASATGITGSMIITKNNGPLPL